jgi:DNA repair exonuclease SbcCD ATPase subunit
MFEMLKKVKEEKAELEKLINDSRRKDNSEGFEGPFNQNLKALDESVKKSERLQRAFDAEKVKLKTLSERVMIAEKEAQAAGPIIEDLESKVEHTLKTVQQHKKETEQVKQKLVQSDAEKNRIKNDLIKANAQIQTLMKRQAS